MDLRKIKKLIELLEESALSEMEITEGDNSIRLSRASNAGNMQTTVPATAVAPVSMAVNTPPVMEAQVDISTDNAAQGTLVESPMVGTFYDTPSPDAEPFVTIGSKVSIGDVLCVVEAMKTFNQIESEVSGTVRAILIEDGQPVEYGEPLIVID